MGIEAGKVYLIFGKPEGWNKNMDLNIATDASFLAESDYDKFGLSISTAGDLNKDGFDDFIIGAYKNDEKGELYSGKVYLVYGKESSWGKNIQIQDIAEGSFLPESPGARAGYSVSFAGDPCGSDFDGFIGGSHYENNSGGGVYLFW